MSTSGAIGAAGGASPTVGETVERRTTPDGREIALVRRDDAFEIVFDGQFLMASGSRRSERALAEIAFAPLAQRHDVTVLVGGLGMGHTLRAVLEEPGVIRVDVVELSGAVVDWNRRFFGPLNGNALADPRVELHEAELLSFVTRKPSQPIAGEEGWTVLLLDVDNGPTWLSRPENEAIYSEEGLACLELALERGGVLAIWSAQREPALLRAMRGRLADVAELAVPVDVQGRANLDYVYRGRRRPERGARRGASLA